KNALSQITLGSHTGTHIDAPAHIDPQGRTTDTYPLEHMNGPCEVVDLSHIVGVISGRDLPPTTATRLLLKTTNSQADPTIFDPGFVALDDSAAAELVRRQIQLIGLDALSIKKKGVRDNVHRLLLAAGIVILEGLWLPTTRAGAYELLCLPLPVALDGAPVRAVLRDLVE
ncbi:MAG: cyclase family protein, partial [Candidatus Andersenbacteria bacterium]